MSSRLAMRKLVVAIGVAFLACLVTSGREARSNPRLFVDRTVAFEREFRHNFPFMIRVRKEDGSLFDDSSTVKVTYTDTDPMTAPLNWPAEAKFSKSKKTLLIIATAKDPRKKTAATAGSTTANGTGTIVIDTSTMTSATTSDTPIPVSSNTDTEEYP